MKKKKQLKSRILKAPAKPGIQASAQLNGLIDEMTEEYRRKLFEIDNGNAAQLQGALNALEDKYQTLFDQRAPDIAKTLVSGSAQAATVQTEGILRTLSRDYSLSMESYKTGGLGQIFSALTQESAELFKTIPAVYHTQVQQAVMHSITDGKGIQDLVPFFDKFSDGSKNYAKLRAMDQTRKAFNGISRAKVQDSGIKKFEWIHSGGSWHPRKLHQELNGKQFLFSDPPYIGDMYGIRIHGFGGDLPNCRCTFRLIVEPT